MKHLFNLFIIAITICLFSSCSSTIPLAVTENEVGDKTGTSQNTCLFAFSESYFSNNPRYSSTTRGKIPTSTGTCFNNDDYGIREAAERAGIENVATVDLETTWYVFWTTYELHVNGK